MNLSKKHILLSAFVLLLLLSVAFVCTVGNNKHLRQEIRYEERQTQLIRDMIDEEKEYFDKISRSPIQVIHDIAKCYDTCRTYFELLDKHLCRLIGNRTSTQSESNKYIFIGSKRSSLSSQEATELYKELCMIRQKCLSIILPTITRSQYSKLLFPDSIYVRLKSNKIPHYNTLQTLAFLKKLQNEVLFSEYNFCNMVSSSFTWDGSLIYSFITVKTDGNIFKKNDTAISQLILGTPVSVDFVKIGNDSFNVKQEYFEMDLNTSRKGVNVVEGLMVKMIKKTGETKMYPFKFNYYVK